MVYGVRIIIENGKFRVWNFFILIYRKLRDFFMFLKNFWFVIIRGSSRKNIYIIFNFVGCGFVMWVYLYFLNKCFKRKVV